MRIEPVDPRDAAWERDDATYRVYVWTPERSACSEYRLRDAASVREALRWAEDQVAPGGPHDGSSIELWLEVAGDGDAVGLVRLDAAAPTEA